MRKLLKSKMLYLALGVCVMVIAVNGFVSRIRDFNTQVEQFATDYEIDIKEAAKEEYVTEFTESSVDYTITEQKEIAEEPLTEATSESMYIELPLQGELLAEHSCGDLVYNKTLEDWRTHNGIDIAAEIGTAVKAAAAGKVTKVGYDSLNGFCIEIEHSDNFVTKYCGLQESDIIEVNINVNKGDVIGGVGTTMESEAAETPHLHFELIKDNISVNPFQYIENIIL